MLLIAFGFLMSVLRMYEVATNFSSVRLPKLVRKEKELPDFETILDIFKGDAIELPVLLAAWMSLRIGEVTGLQFRDVDEEKKLLHIRRTLIMTENGLELREGCKTEKSTRTLPIPDYILDLIKAVPHKKDTDPIITITQKALRSRFKRRVVKRGYDITFHDLRHLTPPFSHKSQTTLLRQNNPLHNNGHVNPAFDIAIIYIAL